MTRLDNAQLFIFAAACSALFAAGPSCCGADKPSDDGIRDTGAPDDDAAVGSDTETNTASLEANTETGLGDTEDTAPLVELETDFETDPSNLVFGEPCALEEYIGGFKVEMNVDSGYTAVDGTVRNAVDPAAAFEEFIHDGDCKILRRIRSICDPPCPSGETCGKDEKCLPIPTGQNVGILAIQGLVKTVIIEPAQPGNTYFFTRLSHPGFDPQDVIRLTTTGGYLDPIELFGVGVEPLAPPDDTWILEEGLPLEIEWPPPADGAVSRMKIDLNIDQHGLTPLTLVCDLPDTGAATISSALVDELIDAGVTGFPSGSMVRRTLDSTRTDAGCVDFQVTSVARASIEVTGHVPCARDEDCPSPLICNTEIQQCQP